ncbi:MAG TPA: hypothetical protein VFC03_05345 [Acidimicrobiales bacterium]|nr:hypothetical protein [Acidimicrobiales bacterium]
MLSDEMITVKPVLSALANELGIDNPLDSEAPKGLTDTFRGPAGQHALQLARSEGSLSLSKPGQYVTVKGRRHDGERMSEIHRNLPS